MNRITNVGGSSYEVKGLPFRYRNNFLQAFGAFFVTFRVCMCGSILAIEFWTTVRLLLRLLPNPK